MNRKMKGIAVTMAMITYALMAGVGVTAGPVAYDQFAGNATMPDSAFHFVEMTGENIRCTIAVNKSNCYLNLVQERTQELAYIQTRLQSMSGAEKEKYEAIAAKTQEYITQSAVAAQNAEKKNGGI